MKKDSVGRKIKIKDLDGNSKTYNVLFTFHSNDLGRSYVLVYPEKDAKSRDLGVKAYRLPKGADPTVPVGGHLVEAQTPKEWDVIESVLNTFLTPDDR